jgi:DNA-binding NarL/FixJ family response regulator
MQPSAIPVSLIVSHPIAREQYCGVISNYSELRIVQRTEPSSVALFDIPPENVARQLTALQMASPMSRPVIMSPTEDDNTCLHWVQQGFWGLVTYGNYRQDVPRSLLLVSTGHLWFPATTVRTCMNLSKGIQSSSNVVEITTRERQVLRLVQIKYSNKEIACSLGITERTAKFHVSQILRKFGASSRYDLCA